MLALCLMLATAAAPAPAHAEWTALLKTYVHSGEVDYRGLKEHAAVLNGYLRTLVAVKDAKALPPGERMAFWINAYNAYTVRLILDHYPVDSIRSIGLLPGAAFRQGFIPLTGKELSLNGIEDRLRAMKDPRIHFALVCASKSCPELRPEAYTGARIEAQLDDAARRFLADKRKNRFDAPDRTLRVSSIFKWYRGDFEGAGGSLESWLVRYAPAAAGPALRGGGAKIEFLDYDWSLNGR